MWIIIPNTWSPNPPPPSCFSPLKSVPLSLNAYTVDGFGAFGGDGDVVGGGGAGLVFDGVDAALADFNRWEGYDDHTGAVDADYPGVPPALAV